jgi:hypothetical protein
MLLESTLSLASRAETRTCTVEFAAVEAEAVVRHSIVPVVLEVTVQGARTAVALDMMSTIILVLLELKPLPVSVSVAFAARAVAEAAVNAAVREERT